jgi:hypothetical protein
MEKIMRSFVRFFGLPTTIFLVLAAVYQFAHKTDKVPEYSDRDKQIQTFYDSRLGWKPGRGQTVHLSGESSRISSDQSGFMALANPPTLSEIESTLGAPDDHDPKNGNARWKGNWKRLAAICCASNGRVLGLVLDDKMIRSETDVSPYDSHTSTGDLASIDY